MPFRIYWKDGMGMYVSDPDRLVGQRVILGDVLPPPTPDEMMAVYDKLGLLDSCPNCGQTMAKGDAQCWECDEDDERERRMCR